MTIFYIPNHLIMQFKKSMIKIKKFIEMCHLA